MMFKQKSRIIAFTSFVTVVVLLVGLVVVISLAKEDPGRQPAYTVVKPPESMDQFYPPQAEAPVYLFEMFELEAAFGAVVAGVQQGNLEAAQGAYQGFLEKYGQVSNMVPEWQDYFDTELTDALDEALKSGDPERIQQTMGGVGGTCGSCHEDTMLGAWYRYSWKNFGEISVEDPISQQEVDFGDYMHMLAGDFGGIGAGLKQGQLEGSRKAYQSFKSRMEGLETVCEDCHETDRHYYVSQDVTDLLTALGAELNSEEPNPQKVGELSGQVGMANCRGCHLVHVPAAMVQDAWEDELLAD